MKYGENEGNAASSSLDELFFFFLEMSNAESTDVMERIKSSGAIKRVMPRYAVVPIVEKGCPKK